MADEDESDNDDGGDGCGDGDDGGGAGGEAAGWVHATRALRDPALKMVHDINMAPGRQTTRLEVEDHEIDHQHIGVPRCSHPHAESPISSPEIAISPPEKSLARRRSSIAVGANTTAVRRGGRRGEHELEVDLINRKQHESVSDETGVPRLDEDATSRLERAIFENAPINHAIAVSAGLSPPRPLRRRAPTLASPTSSRRDGELAADLATSRRNFSAPRLSASPRPAASAASASAPLLSPPRRLHAEVES